MEAKNKMKKADWERFENQIDKIKCQGCHSER